MCCFKSFFSFYSVGTAVVELCARAFLRQNLCWLLTLLLHDVLLYRFVFDSRTLGRWLLQEPTVVFDGFGAYDTELLQI